MEKLLTVRDVANRLNVCLETVRRLVKSGKLPSIRYNTKDYRFHPDVIDSFICRGGLKDVGAETSAPASPIPDALLEDSVRVIENDERGALIVFNDSVLPYITVNNLPVILSKLGITDEKTINDVIAEFTRVASAPPAVWRTDYAAYQAEVRAAYEALAADEAWLKKWQDYYDKFHEGATARLSLDKAFAWWESEAGWENRKKKRTNNFNWRKTFDNAMQQRMNLVYKSKRPQMTNYLGGIGGDWQYTPPPSGGEGVK